MISFAVKIVLQVLLESSVTARFPTTSDPAGDKSDWTSRSECAVNAQARRGTDGHTLVPVVAFCPCPRPRPRLRDHILFVPEFEGQSHGLTWY